MSEAFWCRVLSHSPAITADLSWDDLGSSAPATCAHGVPTQFQRTLDFLLPAAFRLVWRNYSAMTPDFSQEPFTPHLGRAHKEDDQWRREGSFV